MKALIFAAGLGTRLKPLTDTLPKALVPVCGQPLLYHVLQKVKNAGCSGAVVNVHHFPEQIVNYLQRNDFGLPVQVSREDDCLLETGGGILHAKDLLEPLDGPFLVHNVDIVSNLDIPALCQSARPGALATLVVSERETRRYLLFDDAMRLVGWTDRQTSEVRSPYPSLNPARCRQLAFAGIHLLSPGIFEAFAREGFSGRFPIMDFYIRACADFPIYGYLPDRLQMVDVGKADELSLARQRCAQILLQNR